MPDGGGLPIDVIDHSGTVTCKGESAVRGDHIRVSGGVAGDDGPAARHVFAHDHVVSSLATVRKDADIGLPVHLPHLGVVHEGNEADPFEGDAVLMEGPLENHQAVIASGGERDMGGIRHGGQRERPLVYPGTDEVGVGMALHEYPHGCDHQILSLAEFKFAA